MSPKGHIRLRTYSLCGKKEAREMGHAVRVSQERPESMTKTKKEYLPFQTKRWPETEIWIRNNGSPRWAKPTGKGRKSEGIGGSR